MSPQVNDALNRLLALLCRSFPQYLTHAKPFSAQGDQPALEAIDQIVADQIQMSQRVSSFILQHQGRLDTGEFPMEFTDAHDLSVEFILRRARAYQAQDIAALDRIVADLRLAPAALHLAQESLGLAKGHLEALEEVGEPNGELQMTNDE